MKRIFFLLLLLNASVAYPQRIITTIAGNGLSNGGVGNDLPITSAVYPFDLAFGPNGDLYFSEFSSYSIRKIDVKLGKISTIAGNGTQGFSGDGGLATSAQFNEPRGIAVDKDGNIYICDFWNNRVRKVDAATGIITTIAGTGEQNHTGDGGLAVNATLYHPDDIALDEDGNLYIADLNNSCIRKVSKSTGIITTIAGTPRVSGDSGDGALATAALLASPYSVAVDKEKNVYVASWSVNKIRKIDHTTGIITTIAGNGTLGNSGDGGPATQASLYGPQAVDVDPEGNIYISEAVNEYQNSKVRKINKVTGLISSIAGNGSYGYSGDGGPATQAQLKSPFHYAFDANNNIYLSETYSRRIRKIGYLQPPLPPKIIFTDSCLADGMKFRIQSVVPVFGVSWDFGDPSSAALNTSIDAEPQHIFSKAGMFTVTALVTTEDGFKQLEATVTIKDCVCVLEVPNVFTPNDDGVNDLYQIATNCPLEGFELTVINRWGQVVFHSTDSHVNWNGNENGNALASGVYFFSLTHKFPQLPAHTQKGTLTVVR